MCFGPRVFTVVLVGSSALFSRWVVPLASVIKTKARCRERSRAREPPYVGEKLPELHRERAVYPAAHLAMELGLDSAGMRSDPDINPLAIERILPDHLMGIQGDRISESLCDQVAHGRFCVDRVRLNNLGKVIQHHIEVHDWE